MRQRHDRSNTRGNALWGSNSRGESRDNALWGRGKRGYVPWGGGGRGFLLLAVAALAIVLPLNASAAGPQTPPGPRSESFIAPELLAAAQADPHTVLHVIIQSDAGADNVVGRLHHVGGEVRARLGLIGAAAATIRADKLEKLAKQPGLTITADAPIKLSGLAYTSTQLWPYKSGDAKLWGTTYRPAPATGTIAIVDSGLDPDRADFGNGARVLPQVTLTTRTPNSPGDGRGHGTFVASIAAGTAPGYAGAAPTAKILPIDVMDDTGTALTSDVISACSYILQNKTALNITVANFSLHSGALNNFYNDPLDRAVEQLWFNGVFVVAAAGNYGSPAGPSRVLYAPGNDPFVMTVGAVDIGVKMSMDNDAAAPFSAWGYTEDGFLKPDIGAPGRYMVGAVPTSATLTSERPANVVSPGYMELSGTSFAAPVVAGSAAVIMARHPTWTPDQVKGALMVTAKPLTQAVLGSVGVGELNAARAANYYWTPPNPNQGVDGFLRTNGSGNSVFDAASWSGVVKSNASWSSASWSDASWSSATWSSASWSDASWSDASWSDASWSDDSWSDASWSDLSAEDAAEGDATGPAALLDPLDAAVFEADPSLIPDP